MIGEIMNIALSIANQGMNAAVKQQSQSAQRIANLNSRPTEVNLAEEMVNQIVSEHSFAANVTVAKTANEMLGNVIDLLA